jgi:uncharacterized protein (TIGR02271 family)
MPDETIVAVYDTPAHAQAAANDLRAASVPESAISVQTEGGSLAGSATSAAPQREQGFWSSLFGGEPDHDTAVYDRSVQGGSSVVTVKVPDQHVTRVVQILESHGPVDIDDRANSYGLTQTTTKTPVAAPVQGVATGTATTEGGSIQLAEEQLAVGKRLVNRGSTRIRRFVVETPVQEQVTLHDEKLTIERRPVTDGRPVGDDAQFSVKVIEATATGEEAVVSKTARVVEEVSLRKEAAERVETVRDTVRKEQVEIEQVPGGTVTSGTNVPGTPGKPKI